MLESVIKGDTVREVLDYVEFDADVLEVDGHLINLAREEDSPTRFFSQSLQHFVILRFRHSKEAARVCADDAAICHCEGPSNHKVNRAGVPGPGRARGNRSPVTDLNLSGLQMNTAALAVAAGATGGKEGVRALNGNLVRSGDRHHARRARTYRAVIDLCPVLERHVLGGHNDVTRRSSVSPRALRLREDAAAS